MQKGINKISFSMGASVGITGFKITDLQAPVYVTADADYLPSATRPLSGEGSEASPYLIASAEDFIAMNAWIGLDESYAKAYYKMTADIDFSGTDFAGINASVGFSGSFDGNGHVVKNLKIERILKPNNGLFGKVLGGTVKNLGIESASIDSVSIKDGKIETVLSQDGAYKTVLYGSDNRNVVALDGSVYQPLTTQKVLLILDIAKADTGEVVDRIERNIELTVNGTYDSSGENEVPNVVPGLREWYGLSGNFTVNANTRIVAESADIKELAERIGGYLEYMLGMTLDTTVSTARAGDIVLRLNTAPLGEHFPDQLHPNKTAHRIMAEALCAYIQTII